LQCRCYASNIFSEVDWDQKASATFHTKKSKRPPILLQMGPFLTFCIRD
jgi:hypothetical protein